MRIGIFTDTYFPQINGVTYTINLWKRKLEEAGHEVILFYPSGEYVPQKNEFPLRSVGFRYYEGYKIAIPSWVLRNARGLDVVHIHGLFSQAIMGAYVSKLLGVPKLHTFHTPGDEYVGYLTKRKPLKKGLTKLYNLWERKLLNSFDIVTCPSKVIKKRLIQKGIKNPVVLSNGVDLDFFRPVDRDLFREKYCIGDEKLIGYCGRLCHEKRLEDLINVSGKFEGKIVIIGNGPAEAHYRRLAKRKKNISFFGFLSKEDQRAFYSALDVFVFPSIAETQGLVALEAMACGTPVVGASEMALEETIKNARTGYLYESGNIDDLSRKIDLAYANRKKLSKLCLKEVSKHSADKTIEKVLLMYESQIQKSAEMKNKGSKLSIAKSKVNNILRRRKQKEIDA